MVWVRAGQTAAAALLAAAPFSWGTISITQNSGTKWTIGNGDLSVNFDPATNNLTSVAVGSSGNLLDPSSSELYPEFAGTPFGGGAQTSSFQQTSNYIDFWTTTASTGTSTNPITYSFHYVMFNNDPDIVCYEVLNHAATDPATSVGQGQFLARVNPTLFYNSYQMNVSPNNPGAQTSVIQNPYDFPTQVGRTVQDATVDLTGSGIPGNWGGISYTKYDYSSYTQFLAANTEYGSAYSVSTIFTSMDTMNGGPTKQDLQYTNNIAMIEFLSGHYGESNYSYVPEQGVATTKLYGPYDFSFNAVSGQSGATLEQNAINSIPSLETDYNSDSELITSGYVPTTTTARGAIQVNATSTAGWSSNVNNNTVVFSDPNKMFQESGTGYQYWSQLSNSGAASISNVVPGTYRMTVYQLGQWGETRIDGVQVAAGQTTTPTSPQFIPENFSTTGNSPIWTIGTPDRSSHEFLNGNNDSYAYSNGNVTGTPVTTNGVTPGGDLRQYWGNYNYWQEEANLGHNGYVSYYATAVGATHATNNPLDWIANQWGKFNPGIYDPNNNTTDGYTNTLGYVPPNGTQPAYVASGGGAASYGGSPWQINFTTTAAQSAQGQFVVLSVGLADNEGSLTISLNGHSEIWHVGGTSTDAMVRSGDAGVYEMLVYQWPVSDLNAAGTQDQFTLSVSQTDGDMYDALRMEITNTSAAPNTTGWHDYAYINSNGSTNAANPDNILPTDPSAWNSSTGGSWTTSADWNFGIPKAAGATAYLSSSPGLSSSGSITLDGNQTVGTLDFNDSASYTIAQGSGSGSLIMDNGSAQALIVDEAGNHTISAPVILNSPTNISVTAGTNTVTISGPISGSNNLIFSGTGTLLLGSASNSYTGSTAVNGGILIFGNTNTSVPGKVYISGGTVQVGTGGTTGTLPAGSVDDGGILIFDRSDSLLSVSNSISGTGVVTQAGTGTLVLNSINTYSGGTNVNVGAVRMSSILSNGSGGVTVASAGKFDLNGFSPTFAFLSGLGIVDDIAGGGRPTLTLAVTATTPVTFSGSLKNTTGTVSLIKSGTGTQVLTGTNTYTGSTTISAGQLKIGTGGSLNATGTINVNAARGLVLGNGVTISNPIVVNAGANEFIDVPDANASATLAGAVSLSAAVGGTLEQGITGAGATLTITNLETAMNGATGVLTRGTQIFSGSGHFDNDAGTLNLATLGALNLTLKNLGFVNTHVLSVGNNLTTAGNLTLTIQDQAGLEDDTNFDLQDINVSGSTDTINLNGGSLEVGAFIKTKNDTSHTAALNLNGGTVVPELSSAAFLPNFSGLTVSVLAGGAIFDPSNTATSDTVAAPLISGATADGGVTLQGVSTLTLSGANTYNGPTKVTGGILILAGDNSGAAGSTSISAGAVLQIGSGAAAGSLPAGSVTDSGTLTFNLSTTTSISNAISGTGGVVQAGSGTQTLLAVNHYTGDTTVNSGTLTVAAGGSIGSTNNLTVAAGATLNLLGSLSATPALTANGVANFAGNAGVAGPVPVALASLSIGAVGATTFNSAAAHANRWVVEVGSLTFANTPAAPAGLLNLRDNDLIVHDGNLSDIISEIAAASDEGLWNGSGGITSSVAAAAGNTTLAAVLNDDGTGTQTRLYGTFDGQSVIDSDVLVKYTFFGDANFDGVVNASDYLAIDNGFDSQTSSDVLTGWQNGDFNADGKTNGDDYTLIDNAFNSQGTVNYSEVGIPTEMIASDTEEVSAVPEPGSGCWLLVAGCGWMRRQRRRGRS